MNEGLQGLREIRGRWARRVSKVILAVLVQRGIEEIRGLWVHRVFPVLQGREATEEIQGR